MNYIKLDTSGFATNSLFNITTPLLAKTVKGLGYDQDRLNYINESYQRFIGNPFDYVKMDQASYIVKKAIINQEKILIFSSYSPDGIYSLAMICRVFNNFGANYGKYVPNRFIDGKQLNDSIVSSIIRKGYRVVICLDNGIAKNPAIQRLRDNGIEVIIIDAHTFTGETSKASAIINVAFKSRDVDELTTTTSLTYKFVKALIGYDDDYFINLIGLSIVENHLPLSDNTYHMLKRALYLANNKKYPYLQLLVKKDHFINETSLAKVNNAIHAFANCTQGNDINSLVDAFVATDVEDLHHISTLIARYKREYRQLFDECVDNMKISCLSECVSLIDFKNVPSYVIDSILDNQYYGNDNLNVAINEVEDGNYKLKFIYDYRLAKVIKGYRKGGSNICSIIINKEQKDEILTNLAKIGYDDNETYLIEIDEEDLSFKGVSNLMSFGPFGRGNILPWYLLKGVKKEYLNVSVKGEHLTGKINDELYLIAYNKGYEYEDLDDTFSIVFKPEKNFFGEHECVSLNIREFLKEGK